MPKTLLLADDSVTIQKVVGITFANEDVELVTALNGDDALRKARELKPDLVMADIGMPGLDGYELCAAIRAEPELANIPVLLLTGTFETYDEERAVEVGASAYIAKPFEAQGLIDQVNTLLNTPPESAAPAPKPGHDEADSPHANSRHVLGAVPLSRPTSREADSDKKLPSAEPPDLLAGPLGAPLPPPAAGTTRSSDLTFEDLDFQAAPAGDSGSNTQIFGDAPPLASGSVGQQRSSASEPIAEAVDTDPGFDQNGETAFLDPMTLPTKPDQEPLGDAIEDAGPGTPAASSPFAGLDAAPAEALPSRDESVIDVPEVLPEPEPLQTMTFPEPIPSESVPMGRTAGSAGPALDQQAISNAIEKVAWEAFGNLSEQLVREVVKKVESIAWEVVPQLAERMLQEEIDKLKRGSE